MRLDSSPTKSLSKLVYLSLNWHKHAQLHVFQDNILVHAFDLRIVGHDVGCDLVIVADVSRSDRRLIGADGPRRTLTAFALSSMIKR